MAVNGEILPDCLHHDEDKPEVIVKPDNAADHKGKGE